MFVRGAIGGGEGAANAPRLAASCSGGCCRGASGALAWGSAGSGSPARAVQLCSVLRPAGTKHKAASAAAQVRNIGLGLLHPTGANDVLISYTLFVRDFLFFFFHKRGKGSC